MYVCTYTHPHRVRHTHTHTHKRKLTHEREEKEGGGEKERTESHQSRRWMLSETQRVISRAVIISLGARRQEPFRHPAIVGVVTWSQGLERDRVGVGVSGR